MTRIVLAALLALGIGAGCSPVTLGQKFKIDPTRELKAGHDKKDDVLRKMGRPYRTFIDSKGHEILTYVWANGKGGGKKCLVALNETGTVYLVEISQ